VVRLGGGARSLNNIVFKFIRNVHKINISSLLIQAFRVRWRLWPDQERRVSGPPLVGRNKPFLTLRSLGTIPDRYFLITEGVIGSKVGDVETSVGCLKCERCFH